MLFHQVDDCLIRVLKLALSNTEVTSIDTAWTSMRRLVLAGAHALPRVALASDAQRSPCALTPDEADTDTALRRPTVLIKWHFSSHITLIAHRCGYVRAQIRSVGSPGLRASTDSAASPTLFHRLLIHLFDQDVDVVGHAFEVLSQELIFSFEKLFLFFLIGERLEYLWCVFHLFNFGFRFIQRCLDKFERIGGASASLTNSAACATTHDRCILRWRSVTLNT
mmetsp:Transcript_22804/g.28235  ORF Transcript_22804/g.28235 Transcript_22804/m.28235 type:complete len:223 (-) Transcript_22804:592-1260(-)